MKKTQKPPMTVAEYYKRKVEIFKEFRDLQEEFIRGNATAKKGEHILDEGKTVQVEEIRLTDRIHDQQQDFMEIIYRVRGYKPDGNTMNLSTRLIYKIIH